MTERASAGYPQHVAIRGSRPRSGEAGTVRAIDTHFHWYPASIYERLAERTEYPRAVKVGDGFRYLYTPDQGGDRSRIWLDLEGGFAASDAASGPGTTVVNTTGT